jgi:putative endonuclease
VGADPGRARRVARELGQEGERAAARFLEARGYEVIGRGFRARRGELDLICRRGERLVLVEVKTRSSDRFGTPVEAVGPRKRRALAAAAAEYRALAGWRGPLSFALACVTVGDDGLQVELIEDPFA